MPKGSGKPSERHNFTDPFYLVPRVSETRDTKICGDIQYTCVRFLRIIPNVTLHHNRNLKHSLQRDINKAEIDLAQGYRM